MAAVDDQAAGPARAAAGPPVLQRRGAQRHVRAGYQCGQVDEREHRWSAPWQRFSAAYLARVEIRTSDITVGDLDLPGPLVRRRQLRV
ncbi:hypothetical protein DKT69_27235 [Micromonospora sicca]|uniref:Uncharacterized protein n=1 Tax=Micromonospora sicca TaxID=2202420 RepID=A0A317D9B2_9ACTN|nr:hypothetical protein DKT69_27235 [Micromonospora sp. 4G51]